MNKNEKLLADFSAFCAKHPELRFWQALRAWSGFSAILVADKQDLTSNILTGLQDTYYWDGKTE